MKSATPILATFAVIAAVLPMAFVGGLMGPYMRQSDWSQCGHALFAADCVIVTPWASLRILRWRQGLAPQQASGQSGHPPPPTLRMKRTPLPGSTARDGTLD